MSLLKVLMSRGIFLFALLFVIVDLIIIFAVKSLDGWTIFWIEVLALFFYIVSQLVDSKNETIWFLKKE